jgi:hypothetical protein
VVLEAAVRSEVVAVAVLFEVVVEDSQSCKEKS